MRLALRPASVLAAALAAAALAGCSNNRAVYKSTPHRPTSVAIVDTTTHKPLWSKDIPINQKLTMDYNFSPGYVEMFWNPQGPPDSMSWTLRPITTVTPAPQGYYVTPSSKSGTVQLSGNPVMTRMSIRKAKHPRPVNEEDFNTANPGSTSQAQPGASSSQPAPQPGIESTPAEPMGQENHASGAGAAGESQ